MNNNQDIKSCFLKLSALTEQIADAITSIKNIISSFESDSNAKILEASKHKYVCNKCQDTHMVWDSRYSHQIMCIFCPTPCQKCRANGNGPYCAQTFCECSCHRKSSIY